MEHPGRFDGGSGERHLQGQLFPTEPDSSQPVAFLARSWGAIRLRRTACRDGAAPPLDRGRGSYGGGHSATLTGAPTSPYRLTISAF